MIELEMLGDRSGRARVLQPSPSVAAMLPSLTLLQLSAAFCYVFAQDADLPSYIKPCRYDVGAAEFEACVRQQLETALPRFARGEPAGAAGAAGVAAGAGAPALDPLRLRDVAVDAAGLRLTLANASMHGLASAQVHDLRVDLKEEKFTLKFVSNMSVTGAYRVAGRILLLPILGDGDCAITAYNTEVEISSKLSVSKSQRGEHLQLVAPSYRYQIQRTTFRFQNLFNGNKELSDATHRFANENWQQLMEELAPPVVRQIVRTCVRAINQFFGGVPLRRLVVGYTPSAPSAPAAPPRAPRAPRALRALHVMAPAPDTLAGPSPSSRHQR